MVNKKRHNIKLNAIAKLRKEAKLTQQELAELLDITRTHLSNIENGKTMPGGEIVTKLTILFNKTAEEIFFNEPVHHSKQSSA